MKPEQEKIYFTVNQQYDLALKSPYMEPFKGSDIDVLVLTVNIDEILFNQVGEFKGKRFVSIESSFEEIQKDLGKDTDVDVMERSRIPEEEITPFCLWMKETLKGQIGKVSISKRLTETPAIISGQMSSSMRVMMQMLEQSGQAPNMGDLNALSKDQTLELNANHPIIVNLNQLRKNNQPAATLVTRQLLDNVLASSNVPFDLQASTERQYKLLSSYLEVMVTNDESHQATRATHEQDDSSEQTESAMKRAQKEARGGANSDTGKRIVREHKVTREDIDQAN